MIKQPDISFGEFIRSQRVEVPVTPPAEPPKQRQHATRSGIVICRRGKDGRIDERSARPAFLFRDPRSVTEMIVLPAGYYWRGSSEHLARREELESGA